MKVWSSRSVPAVAGVARTSPPAPFMERWVRSASVSGVLRSAPPRLRPCVIALFLACCLLMQAGIAAARDDVWSVAIQVNNAIDNWDYETAGELVQALDAEFVDHPAALFVSGRYDYHMGLYDRATVKLDDALRTMGNHRMRARVQQTRDLVANTGDVVREFDSYTTPDGHFEIRYQGPRDDVLMPWAGETLEAAYYNIGYSVGYWPSKPVRVEIYPRARTLAVVSSLPEEAVETTSTIGLCKYNKLMFASPRATLRGYGWRDTLAHEYTHYVISSLAGRGVPVWLHEGLAKYLETRWRGTWEGALEPSREDLLSRRLEDNNLVEFEEMHPSLSLLPSQEDASTAYAQVFTVIEYLVQRRGHGAIRDLLLAIRDGAMVEDAFAQTVDEPWSVFERNWRRYLTDERPRVDLPGEFADEIHLLSESMGDDAPSEFEGVNQPAAEEFLQLGQLLRARGLVGASIEEYRKAEALLGPYNPIVQNSMARALLETDQPDLALEAVSQVTEWYPGYYLSHLHRAESLNKLGRHSEALPALEAAVGINPFDPRVHSEYARAYDAAGNTELAERARRFARIVDTN